MEVPKPNLVKQNVTWTIWHKKKSLIAVTIRHIAFIGGDDDDDDNHHYTNGDSCLDDRAGFNACAPLDSSNDTSSSRLVNL